ncbi:MAG TPA: serine/threonine-protein kinase [Gemmataceae bacterium]|nr:serine/threonine-protein kinase [Gemmataceae bacterium]
MFPSTQIPGYDFIHTLGAGSESLVFRARERTTGEHVAIKVSHEHENASREAAVGLAVRHPHLVHVRAAQIAEQPNFVVMELLSGVSLRCVMHQRYALPIRLALRVTRQLTEALVAMHRAGFVHGDVKPENVQWVDAKNVVLIDLGLARRCEINSEKNECIFGTADYLAPECCFGSSQASDRSDIFSLGVMLFEMLTGGLPYSSGTANEVIRSHRAQAPTDLRKYPGEWPWRLVRLLHRMLAYRPCDRPAATLLVQELMELEIVAKHESPRTAVRGHS